MAFFLCFFSCSAGTYAASVGTVSCTQVRIGCNTTNMLHFSFLPETCNVKLQTSHQKFNPSSLFFGGGFLFNSVPRERTWPQQAQHPSLHAKNAVRDTIARQKGLPVALIAQLVRGTFSSLFSPQSNSFSHSFLICSCSSFLSSFSPSPNPPKKPTIKIPPTPSGTYSTKTGANSSSFCLSCPDGGFSSLSGSSSCSLCPAGSWGNTTGSTSLSSACRSCSIGKYSPTIGAITSSTCLIAPLGSYVNTSGASVFSPCPRGTWSSSLGATTESTCISCTVGKASNTLQANSSLYCTECSQGSYAASKGSSTCSLCDQGKYNSLTGSSSSSACISCPAGTYSSILGAVSVSSCLSCPSGKSSCQGSNYCDLFNLNVSSPFNWLLPSFFLIITLIVGKLIVGLEWTDLFLVAVATADLASDLNYILSTSFIHRFGMVTVMVLAFLPALQFFYYITFYKPQAPRSLPFLPSFFAMETFLNSCIWLGGDDLTLPLPVMAALIKRLVGEVDNLGKLLLATLTVIAFSLPYLIKCLALLVFQALHFSLFLVAFLVWASLNGAFIWIPLYVVGALLCQTKLIACKRVKSVWYWLWSGRGLEVETADMHRLDRADLNEMQIGQALLESAPQVVFQGLNIYLLQTKGGNGTCYSDIKTLWAAWISIGFSALSCFNTLYYFFYYGCVKKKRGLFSVQGEKTSSSLSSWGTSFNIDDGDIDGDDANEDEDDDEEEGTTTAESSSCTHGPPYSMRNPILETEESSGFSSSASVIPLPGDMESILRHQAFLAKEAVRRSCNKQVDEATKKAIKMAEKAAKKTAEKEIREAEKFIDRILEEALEKERKNRAGALVDSESSSSSSKDIEMSFFSPSAWRKYGKEKGLKVEETSP